jgi:hypothetical protein
MSSVKRLALILIATSALLTQAVAQMPHNSFLRKPAHSVSELIQQFKNDPIVQKRFMNHYGVPKEEIIAFFSGLRVERLTQTAYHKVYNVDKFGVIRSRNLKVKAGTLVFLTSDGRPALIRSCGNPTDITIIHIIPPTPRMLMENPVVPPEEMIPLMPEEMLPEAPEMLFPPEVLVPPAVPEFHEVLVPEYRRRRSFFPIPIPIPIVRHKDCPPDVIPGPAAAITFGMMALMRKRRKK